MEQKSVIKLTSPIEFMSPRQRADLEYRAEHRKLDKDEIDAVLSVLSYQTVKAHVEEYQTDEEVVLGFVFVPYEVAKGWVLKLYIQALDKFVSTFKWLGEA